ncbi:MAG TPA: serine/threonine-protein kinase, partial [Myxococcales bacterium]|nr:serine/threonine-protein kinase [Myxococcales bacterium]
MSGGRDESRTDIEVSPPHDGGATTPILGGRYALEELLGSGGMGRVYRARDLKLGRAVAIKLVNCATADRRQRARLEREARAAGALNHPNIVAVHDVGEDNGEPYVVSELLEGETLRTRLERGPLPRELALDLGIQLASGVAAAHRHGIVHRDLKPENLFVTREGHLKILDFGIAKPIGAAAEDDGMQTDRSYVVGTPKYMSPEQVKGEPADARSDVFACGAVLQEMLTGTPPFGRAGTIETAYAVLHDAPPPLPDSRFSRVVARCLSKSPESRHSSGAELLDDLRRLARDAPVGRSWISRRTTAAVSLAMVLAAAIALV